MGAVHTCCTSTAGCCHKINGINFSIKDYTIKETLSNGNTVVKLENGEYGLLYVKSLNSQSFKKSA